MEKDILLDIATETARRYGDLAPDFADKMAKRIRRKFSIRVEPKEISRLALHYKEIYRYAGSILKEYLKPPHGKYADSSDVDAEKFLQRIGKQFLEDDPVILEKISRYVIYYEYLR